MSEKDHVKKVMSKYVPPVFVAYVVELLFSENVRFRVSKPRKSKRGDYLAPISNAYHQISVNGDLNPYAFLITTLHEFAHMRTFVKFGNNVQPHGKEWKNEFAALLRPVLENDEFPDDLRKVLNRSVLNLKASSCTDQQMYRALKKYDPKKEHTVLLEELTNNRLFVLNNRLFKRGVLRRTRFLCEEVNSGKNYLVSRLAEVTPYID